MKPRHTAALALVGWYLMVAPADYKADMIAPARRFLNGTSIKALITLKNANT
jgi:hypothetical protein